MMTQLFTFVLTTAALSLTSVTNASVCSLANIDRTSKTLTNLNISGMIDFDLELFKNLYSNSAPNKNIFISPYSIWSSIILLYFGSAGNTKTQIEQVLGIQNKEDAITTLKLLEKRYSDLQLTDSKDTFLMANRVFIDDNFQVNPSFTKILSAEIEKLKFLKTDEASQRINKFISEKTSGQIEDLVKSSDLVNAKLVTANAAVFKGTWKDAFDLEDTTEERFYSSEEDYAMVPMMKKRGMFRYGVSDQLDAKVLELPYVHGNISCILLLPIYANGKDMGLGRLMTRLTHGHLREAIHMIHNSTVNVDLPRFKLEYAIGDELIQSLIQLGIEDLFSNSANLSDLSPTEGLEVTKSIHQAMVEVDEEGTLAAAATAFIIEGRTSRGENFPCTRPFLFLLYDNSVGNILFMGAYRNTKK